jgi:transposase
MGRLNERFASNANLDALDEEYAGAEAAIEAIGNYFTVYDTLDEHLDVVLINLF